MTSEKTTYKSPSITILPPQGMRDPPPQRDHKNHQGAFYKYIYPGFTPRESDSSELKWDQGVSIWGFVVLVFFFLTWESLI